MATETRARAHRWVGWSEHFTTNRQTQAALEAVIDWDAPPGLAGAQRERWVASLARFQVGESGDGAHLLDRARRGGEVEYAAAAAAFVAEEQAHARLLGRLLTRLDGEPMARHWSDVGFVRARRLMGVSVELAVISVAEAVALVYYGALAEGAPDPVVRAVAARILHDERAHVRFHADRIRVDLARWGAARRAALWGLWWAAGVAATAVVAVDHSAALADCGLGRVEAVRAVARRIAEVRSQTRAGS